MSQKMFSLALWLVILSGATFLAGCSSGLSRSKAAELIPNHSKFSDTREEQVLFGTVSGGPSFSIYSVLYQLGYTESADENIKLTESGDGKIRLTEKGRRAAVNWRDGSVSGFAKGYMVPLAKREVVEVTGISEPESGGNSAQATFTWRWKPINEIGEAMAVGKQIFNGSATFQKFDDGWRVVMVSGDGIPR